MRYFLGLDAGGTKTIGALADEERELARAETGTIKVLRAKSQLARENLESLFTQLARGQGIDLRNITRTCIGTSGYSVPLVANWIRETVPLLAGGELLLCGDEEIALDAAFYGGAGVLIVAGTGSNVMGRTHDGQIARAGGWGPALADEGSGHWIGHEGLRSAFRARNEGRPTQLLDEVIRYWDLSGLDELVEKANATPSPDFSKLTRVIISCAENGDAVSLEVLNRAGEELAHLAMLVIRQMRQMGEASTPRIAFIGSVLAHIGLVRDSMSQALRRAYAEIEIFPTPVDAVQGALWRARNRVLKRGFTSGIHLV